MPGLRTMHGAARPADNHGTIVAWQGCPSSMLTCHCVIGSEHDLETANVGLGTVRHKHLRATWQRGHAGTIVHPHSCFLLFTPLSLCRSCGSSAPIPNPPSSHLLRFAQASVHFLGDLGAQIGTPLFRPIARVALQGAHASSSLLELVDDVSGDGLGGVTDAERDELRHGSFLLSVGRGWACCERAHLGHVATRVL